jgi:iron complex transport system substrate-binding protein
MNRKILLVILSLILAFSLMTGCNNDTKNQSTEVDASQNKTDDNYPIKITDSSGANLTIESKPSKIASISLCTDEILLSIADKNNILALSSLSDDEGISCVSKEASDIEIKLSSEVEKIVESSPDLIFVPDWSEAAFIEQLKDANITVFIYKTPGTISDVKELIQNIATTIDEKESGTELISWMDEKTISVDEKLKDLEDSEKVSVMSLDSSNYTYGKGTSFDEICEKAHVLNSASEAGMESWAEINKEKIIEINPELIILPTWSYEGLDMEEEAENFRNDESLKNVAAIKNNKVLTLGDKYITSVSQNIVLGVEEVAKNAYPEYFEE